VFSDTDLLHEMKNSLMNAVSLDPTDFESLDRYAWYIYRVDKTLDRALEMLLEAWNLGGNADPWVNYHLGRVYEDLGDNSAARKFYHLAHSLSSGDVYLISNRYAQFLIHNGDTEVAIDVIENVLLPIDPENPVHYLHLVILYAERCDLETAKEYLEDAELLELVNLSSLYGKAVESISSDCK
jgi:tetratricopeptide (TPR) repeat protein